MMLAAYTTVVALISGGPAVALGPAEAARLAAAARVIAAIRSEIPQRSWDRARCVAVVPDLKKAAFFFGGEYGQGVMSCRSGDRWSAPVFLQLAKGSWGFQAGAEQIDLVMLVMNESGVQKLLGDSVNLGAAASVAAGPVGRQGEVAADARIATEVLSYARTQGLFAGIDVSGGIVRPDADANRKAYGAGAVPRTILAMRDISAPTEAHAFLAALNSVSAPAAAAPSTPATSSARRAAPPTSEASAPPPPDTSNAKDDDLRARVVELQQAFDRLLSSSSSAAVATTGAKDTGDAVTLDRAALMRVRQQIDALAAAIDRKR